MKIPLTKPYFDEIDEEAILAPIRSGWVVQGPYVFKFEKLFASYVGAKYAVATSSCTTALHTSLAALGIANGDEVIVPSFTWIATANTVVYQNAKPVFVDIDLNNFNIDVNKIEEKITSKTKAIIPVHLFGLSCQMDKILKISKKYKLSVLEDAACAIGSCYKGKHVGLFGDIGCFSFHPRKLITIGEGGMAVTNNKELAIKMQKLRNHGAEESDLERHRKSKFQLSAFKLLGYNFRMTDIQGVLGITQMKKLEKILKKRKELAARYHKLLAEIKYLQLPQYSDEFTHNFQSYVVLVKDDSPVARDVIARKLLSLGITVRPGTLAVHNTSFYKNNFHTKPNDCPASLKAERQSIALPLYHAMTYKEQDYIIETLMSILY
jgi:dTDP-4-amino-4,6-dideoxygalactose transaminase